MGLLREPIGLGGLGRPLALHLHRAAGVNGSVCAAAAARPAGKHPDHAGGVATPTMRSTTYLYLSSMALSDVLILLLMPLDLYKVCL